MFNKLVLCFLFVAFAMTASPACADLLYPYAGVNVGAALTSVNKLSDSSGSLKTHFNPGYMASMVGGVSFETTPGWNIERMRAEVEIGYRSSELDKMRGSFGQSVKMNGTVSVLNYMVNGYLENTSMVSNDLNLNLFMTAGIGGATASISSVSYQGVKLVKSASDTQFAYQLGAGAGYELTKKITLEATYKYMGATKFGFSGVDAEYGSHNVMFGTRYTFN